MSLQTNLAALARAFLGTAGNQSIAANGYQKLPSGLIIQWGTASTSAGGDVTVTFPLAFPAACFGVTTGIVASGSNIGAIIPSGPTTTSFNLTAYNVAGSRTVQNVYWMAIGY